MGFVMLVMEIWDLSLTYLNWMPVLTFPAETLDLVQPGVGGGRQEAEEQEISCKKYSMG